MLRLWPQSPGATSKRVYRSESQGAFFKSGVTQAKTLNVLRRNGISVVAGAAAGTRARIVTFECLSNLMTTLVTSDGARFVRVSHHVSLRVLRVAAARSAT